MQQQPTQNHLHINPPPEVVAYSAVTIPLNNEAILLARQGDFAGAEQKHLLALELKERDFGRDDIRVALTLNSLGETQLKLNKLDEAEANLRRAVAIREAFDKRGLDAAVSRENLAQVLEAKHNLPEAKETRMRGNPSICCGNYNVCTFVPVCLVFRLHRFDSQCPGQTFKKEDLHVCSSCKVSLNMTLVCCGDAVLMTR